MALLSDKFKLKPQLSGADIKSLYEVEPNAFTDTDKTKLIGIATGAEVNVNADWNAVSGDAQILNKPTLDFEPADPTILKDADIGVSVQGYSANTVIDVDYSTVKATALSATQPGDLSTVATTGAYSDLSGLPTLGTAAATNSTDYATAAQGTLANTALQPDQAETVSGDYTFNGALYLPNNSRINNIEHFYQTTKPTTRGDSSALVVGDRWWKTDDGTEWFWNGTYWVSTQLFTASTIVSGAGTRDASNFTVTQQTPHSDGGPKGLIFVESIAYYCRFNIQSPLDENNFATFKYYVATRNASSTIGEITTLEMNDYHAARIKLIQQPFGYAPGGTDGINGFFMGITHTGSPGSYTGLGTINYRFWYR